jgi:hypothetical protein
MSDKVLWRNNPSIQMEKIMRRRVMVFSASAVLASNLWYLTLNLMAPHAQRLSFSDPSSFERRKKSGFKRRSD